MNWRAWPAWSGFVFATLGLLAGSHAKAQCDGHWLPGDPVPSIVGQAACALSYDDGVQPKLIVGGSFSVPNVPGTDHITAFDGTRWNAMGNGLSGNVRTLFLHEGVLIAGGEFTSSGNTVLNRVAQWDGSNWQPIGGGVSGPVYAFAAYQGELYAGGGFGGAGGQQTRYIARWNGTEWRPVGNGLNSFVWGLAVFDGKLVATGNFTTAGDVPASRIAQWDGVAWSALGTGLSGAGNCVREYGGRLYASGNFQSAGGVSARYVAAWNGLNWSALGAGLLAAAMSFTELNGQLIASSEPARAWNGSAWIILSQSEPSARGTVCVHQNELISAGWSSGFQGGVDVLRAGEWQEFGLVTWDRRVDRLFAVDQLLIAAGTFVRAPGTETSIAAVWDGAGWARMDTGLGLASSGATQLNCAAGYRGDVIGGGNFAVVDGTPSTHLARWDGSQWRTFEGGSDATVTKMFADEDNLYIAGSGYIRRYDGAQWTSLVGGLAVSTVTGIAVFQGELYATGTFRDPNTNQVVQNFVRWDGGGWIPTAHQFSGVSTKLIALEDRLVFWGPLMNLDGHAGTIVEWDGATVTTVLDAPSTVSGATVLRGSLVVIGNLFLPNPAKMARFQGGSWTPFPTYPTQGLLCVAASGTLLGVGGAFTIVDGDISTAVARWREESADFDGDGFVTGADFDLFVGAFEGGEMDADFDRDGFVTGIDFDRYVGVFEAGC